MNTTEILNTATLKLQQSGIDSAGIDSRLLLAHAMQKTIEQVFLVDRIDVSSLKIFNECITRRSEREPVSHITGRREFYGNNFIVTADTLDPRPDTETIIDTVLKYSQELRQHAPVRNEVEQGAFIKTEPSAAKHAPVRNEVEQGVFIKTEPSAAKHAPVRNEVEQGAFKNILDLGTGTGCILLTLLKHFPEATGMGLDISEKALIVAKHNGNNLSLQSRVKFLQGNWGKNLNLKFDLIVSNPPYIRTGNIKNLAPEVAKFEPFLALDGGVDGLDCYKEIAANIKNLMQPDALAIFEIGHDQAKQVAEIFESNSLPVIEIVKDLAGNERCLVIKNKE